MISYLSRPLGTRLKQGGSPVCAEPNISWAGDFSSALCSVAMPKIRCTCGYVHDLSPIPDKGFVVVRDEDVEDDRIGSQTTHMYECTACGRLAWLRDGVVSYYIPEDREKGQT